VVLLWYILTWRDAIDHTKDHTRAMKMLEEAGIYVLFIITHTQHYISRADPQASYKSETLDAFFRKIDEMARFPNTLGFLIASGLINNTSSEICAPVITAVVRDLKKYMKLKYQVIGQRILPVGFGGGQYEGDLKVLNYLTASEDESSRIDLWTVLHWLRIGAESRQRLEPPRWPCRLVPPRQSPHFALRVRHQLKRRTHFPRRHDSVLASRHRCLLRRLRVRVLAG